MSPPDVRIQTGGAFGLPPVLLVKPERTFDELHERYCCDAQPFWAEVKAQETEALFDPANESLVGVLCEPQGAQCLVEGLDDRRSQLPSRGS